MAVHHFTVTISVTTSFQISGTVTTPDPIKFITFQADVSNAGPVYIGGAETLSSSDYGIYLPKPVTSLPAAPIMLGTGNGFLSASEIYFIGTTTDKVHVFLVT